MEHQFEIYIRASCNRTNINEYFNIIYINGMYHVKLTEVDYNPLSKYKTIFKTKELFYALYMFYFKLINTNMDNEIYINMSTQGGVYELYDELFVCKYAYLEAIENLCKDLSVKHIK